MFLILAFINASALFIMLKAEFIAMLLVIVYVGAIAVLFLFVVMMIRIEDIKKKITKTNIWITSIVTVFLFIELYLILLVSSSFSKKLPKINLVKIDESISNTRSIGNVLYTEYIYPFQLSGLILFVAMVGAIVLTLRNDNKRVIKKQSIINQISRSKDDSIELVKVESKKGINI
jgi:NADH-quinone oxidoreductase subunit J